jgi:Fe-S cluster biogenesis protein NfuA
VSENPGGEAESVEQRARAVVDSIRPFIQADGGDIEFLGIENGAVKVRLHGACSGCPHAAYTLTMGVERHLRERVPEITAVVNVP